MLNVTITETAQDYLAGLLEKQNCEGIGIRMFASMMTLSQLKKNRGSTTPSRASR